MAALEAVRRSAAQEHGRLLDVQRSAVPLDRSFWKSRAREALKLQKGAQIALDYATGHRNAETPDELGGAIREALFLAGAT